MRILTVLLSASVFTLAACQTTDTGRQELVDAGEVAGVTSNGDVVRCRMVRETGTRLSNRVCLTERQWEDMTDNAVRAINARDQQGVVAGTQSVPPDNPVSGPG